MLKTPKAKGQLQHRAACVDYVGSKSETFSHHRRLIRRKRTRSLPFWSAGNTSPERSRISYKPLPRLPPQPLPQSAVDGRRLREWDLRVTRD